MRHAARASERARLSPLSAAKQGRERKGERAVPSKRVFCRSINRYLLWREGEGESAPGTAPFAARPLSAPATILAFGLTAAGSRASVPEGTLEWEKVWKGLLKQINTTCFEWARQVNQANMELRESDLSLSHLRFSALPYHQASQGKVFSGVSCATGNKRILFNI